MPKLEKCKCDIFGDFQTLWDTWNKKIRELYYKSEWVDSKANCRIYNPQNAFLLLSLGNPVLYLNFRAKIQSQGFDEMDEIKCT